MKKPFEVVGGFHQVPEGPGLGVEVDEEAVERFRVPDSEIEPFAREGRPYEHPRPRLLSTVVWPDGSCLHMASPNQGYSYFGSGNGPAQMEGTRLEVTPDDGSKEWARPLRPGRARAPSGTAGSVDPVSAEAELQSAGPVAQW